MLSHGDEESGLTERERTHRRKAFTQLEGSTHDLSDSQTGLAAMGN